MLYRVRERGGGDAYVFAGQKVEGGGRCVPHRPRDCPVSELPKDKARDGESSEQTCLSPHFTVYPSVIICHSFASQITTCENGYGFF